MEMIKSVDKTTGKRVCAHCGNAIQNEAYRIGEEKELFCCVDCLCYKLGVMVQDGNGQAWRKFT